MVTIRGTATDPLAAADTDDLVISSGVSGALRTIRSSFFANRINWGNSITETVQGPEATPDPYYHLVGPVTQGLRVTAVAACRTTGMRVMKMPAGHGDVVARCWGSGGATLATATATWVADGGGWFEFNWSAPLDLVAGDVYYFGYFYPSADTDYAFSTYVWNNGQDTCVWPLKVVGSSAPNFTVYGGSAPAWTSVGANYNNSNSYIDPVMEWDVDVPGYDGGLEYWDQFVNGGSRFAFPLVIDWSDPPYVDDYKALGMNTLMIGAWDDDYIEAVKAADIDFYPALHGGDMSGVLAAISDPVLAPMVRGYFLTDEPEYAAGTDTPPSALRTWRNTTRRLDSTRPIYLNLGRTVIENQGFQWQPAGITAQAVNEQWREFMALVDAGSDDCYGIEHTFPYTYQGAGDSARYGIWIYPLIVYRMRDEVTEGRIPIFAEIETTSSYADSPSPTNVRKAVWASLIAGAKGILYFDHRFSSPVVSQDFSAMIEDVAMSAEITALNAQIISLADALNAPEAGYITEYTVTGTLAAAQGGYPAGAKIPLLVSSRAAGGNHYFFVQSIRDGDAGTVTFTIPGFEGVTLTVIDESRTEVVSGAGVVTDTFTGDYAYHLYMTATEPTFTAPANTVAPAITGTAETGSTLTCSTGTWTGVPAPTFSYLWQRADTLPDTWISYLAADSPTHVVTVDDEDVEVRCIVTATNSQGSDDATSNTVTPSAPAPSGWVGAVEALDPVAWWRLDDLTEEINGHDLTEVGSHFSGGLSLIGDLSNGSKVADSSGSSRLTVADHADLRIGQGSFSVHMVAYPGYAPGGMAWVTKYGDFSMGQGSGKWKAGALGAGGWFSHILSTTSLVINTPYRVVFTWDGTTKVAKLYVDGALETTQDQSAFGFAVTSSGWGALDIGKNGTAIPDGYSDGMAPGTIDEVILFDKALTAGEVSDLYDASL